MIRFLLGSALPVLGLGLAAAFVGPSLVPTSGREPILVAGISNAPEFQPASFNGSACAPKLLLSEGAETAGAKAGLPIAAVVMQYGPDGLFFELRSAAGADEGATLLVLLDGSGRVLAASTPGSLLEGAAAGECPDAADTPKPAGAV